MKILMTMYQIQDYGGIINHVEFLAQGLKELGHEVDFRMLIPRDKYTPMRKLPKDIREYTTKLEGTGYPHHQARGWIRVPKIPYLSSYHRKNFVHDMGKYDAVLWHIPVPTLNKDNEGVKEWLELYDNGTKNIAIIHDGNLPHLYPHLAKVSKHFIGSVCVHNSAYESSAKMDLPRTMICNPFDVTQENLNSFEERTGLVAVQIFKAWKRMDTLVRAISYMKNEQSKIVGGAGIEYRYMTSKDKCKEKYFEPDGTRIWDNALKHGMHYAGVLPNEKVFSILKNARVQIDPSWSVKYSGFGSHFNRTTVEAIICGAVPMATDLGMITSSEKVKHPFHSHGDKQNYIQIPHDSTPQEFADIVDDAVTVKVRWLKLQENGKQILPQFDKVNVAQKYIDFINGGYEKIDKGEVDDLVFQKCNKNLQFFNIDPIEPKNDSV